MWVEINPQLLLLLRRELLDGFEDLLIGEFNLRHELFSLLCFRDHSPGSAFWSAPCHEDDWEHVPKAFEKIELGLFSQNEPCVIYSVRIWRSAPVCEAPYYMIIVAACWLGLHQEVAFLLKST